MVMLNSAQKLPDEPTELKNMVGLLSSEVKSQALLIEKLQHQLAGLRRHRFGASSEALDQLQLSLEDEEVAQAAENIEEPVDSGPGSEPKPKVQPKRKPLPDYLPRNEEILSPGDACGQCGGKLKTLAMMLLKNWNMSRVGLLLIRSFVRAWLVPVVRAFNKLPCHPARLSAGGRVPDCWPMFLFLNMRIIFPCTGRARSSNVTAWTCHGPH